MFIFERLVVILFHHSKSQLQLQSTKMKGVIGNIQFDNNGDMAGDILIYQYQKQRGNRNSIYVITQVGTYSISAKQLAINDSLFVWSNFRRNESSGNNFQPVESVCSRPCHADQYVVQLAVPCCWRCEKCRENEVGCAVNVPPIYQCVAEG
jgi:hypothetical protein